MKIVRLLISAIFAVSMFTQYSFAEDAFATDLDGDGDYVFRVIKDGGIKVGDGTPTVTQNGEDAYIEGTLEVDGAVRLDSTLTLSGVATLTSAPVISAGKIGLTGANGNLVYTVKVATTIAANGTYAFTLAAGKAGSYTIHAGTHTTSGTFTSAGAVSISTVSSADLAPVAVTDAGDNPVVTNGAAATKTYMITYDYVN